MIDLFQSGPNLRHLSVEESEGQMPAGSGQAAGDKFLFTLNEEIMSWVFNQIFEFGDVRSKCRNMGPHFTTATTVIVPNIQ